VTILNEKEVRMSVKVPEIRRSAFSKSITNSVSDKIVIRKLNE